MKYQKIGFFRNFICVIKSHFSKKRPSFFLSVWLLIRLLPKPHLPAKIVNFWPAFFSFFSYVLTHCLQKDKKASQKFIIFFRQSKFRKKSSVFKKKWGGFKKLSIFSIKASYARGLILNTLISAAVLFFPVPALPFSREKIGAKNKDLPALYPHNKILFFDRVKISPSFSYASNLENFQISPKTNPSIYLGMNDSQLIVHFMQPSYSASPGEEITVQVSITNPSSKKLFFRENLTVPEGWTASLPQDSLTNLEPGKTFIQTFTVKLPQEIEDNTYKIIYKAYNLDNAIQQGEDDSLVVVRGIKKTVSTNSILKRIPSLPIKKPPQKEDPFLYKNTAYQQILPPTPLILSPTLSLLFPTLAQPSTLTIKCPSHIKTLPGTLIYISSMLETPSRKKIKGELDILLPRGWNSLGPNHYSFNIKAKTSSVEVFAIKIPDDALAGDYEINLVTTGDIEKKETILVTIDKKIDMQGSFSNLKDVYLINQSISSQLSLINKSNIPLKIRFLTDSNPLASIKYPKGIIQMKVGEERDFSIRIDPDEKTKPFTQFVSIKVLDADTDQTIFRKTFFLKIVPIGMDPNQIYNMIPAYFSPMAFFNNNYPLGGLEFVGKGYIDPFKERELDFFFRLLSNNTKYVYNYYRKMFLRIHQPEWDIQLGDSIYRLTPLTQYRYGRGAALGFAHPKVQIGAHYTQNPWKGAQNLRDLCGFFKITPTKEFSLSANYFHQNNPNIPSPKIVTLNSKINLSKKNYTELEYGKNFSDKNWNDKTTAYHFLTRGSFSKDTWYTLEKIYAGSEFEGYYQNANFSTASLQFPISRAIKSSLSVNYLRQNNYNPLSNDNTPIPSLYQKQYNASISYNFFNGNYFSLGAFALKARDISSLKSYNFFQKWGTSSLSLSLRKTSFFAGADFGQQTNYLTHSKSHILQLYRSYLTQTFSRRVKLGLLYDLGNNDYYDAGNWNISYGGFLSFYYSAKGNIELLGRRSRNNKQLIDISQFSIQLNHIFKNQHSLHLQFDDYPSYNNLSSNFYMVAYYKIPFGIPVSKRKDIGTVKGRVYNSWENTPISGALVNLKGKQTYTNREGEFTFSHVPVGEQKLQLEALPKNLTPQENSSQIIQVKGNYENTIEIAALPLCSLKGRVLLYNFEETLTSMDNFIQGKDVKIIQKGGYKGVEIIIDLNQGEKIYTTTSDKKGYFHFPPLKPGHWHMYVKTDNLPPLHYLEESDFTLDIEPEEDKFITLNILPRKIKIQPLTPPEK